MCFAPSDGGVCICITQVIHVKDASRITISDVKSETATGREHASIHDYVRQLVHLFEAEQFHLFAND